MGWIDLTQQLLAPPDLVSLIFSEPHLTPLSRAPPLDSKTKPYPTSNVMQTLKMPDNLLPVLKRRIIDKMQKRGTRFVASQKTNPELPTRHRRTPAIGKTGQQAHSLIQLKRVGSAASHSNNRKVGTSLSELKTSSVTPILRRGRNDIRSLGPSQSSQVLIRS